MKPVQLLIAASLLASCSSATLITTNDKDVKIFIDGQYEGTGQYTHTDSKITGSTTNILLTKEGCENVSYILKRNEKFDVGACTGGVFLLVPLLWIKKYEPVHNYKFECISTNKTPPQLKNKKSNSKQKK